MEFKIFSNISENYFHHLTSLTNNITEMLKTADESKLETSNNSMNVSTEAN